MRKTRRWIAAAVALAQIGVAEADLSQTLEFNIAPQALQEALIKYSSQSKVQVTGAAEVIEGKRSPGISGMLQARSALQQLLVGTNLTFDTINENTVIIRRIVDERASAVGSKDNIHLAQAEQAARAAAATEQMPSDSSPVGLQEVLVTAQKREERLLDTPQSVSALTSSDLNRLAATQFRDFANTVPGLSFTTAGAGYTQATLRGVTSGIDTSPTVGIYVDDVPYGSSSGHNLSSRLALDVGLFDIDRIEVLRGPQGTLYGASTMGGLIKYVGKRPEMNRFGVEAQAGMADTRAGGMSYNAALAVNAPLVADKVAIRASTFYSHDGGYIDNLALGRDDVNRSNIYGARLDALFTPTEALTVRLGGFVQDIKRAGQGTADFFLSGVPRGGELEQSRQFPEPFDQRFRLVSATVGYDFGPAQLTSISSYQSIRTQVDFDISGQFVPVIEAVLGRTYGSVGLPLTQPTDRFTQEVRLASSGNRTLEWLVGGFYTHEKSVYSEAFALRDVNGLPAGNDVYTLTSPERYEEYAAFGDLTYHFTDRFDVSGGLRYAHSSDQFRSDGAGVFGASTPERSSTENVSTYLANARYHFSERAMGYVRFATGYRPGGPNFAGTDPTTGLPREPQVFDADRLKSYEAGFKAESADRRFVVDAAVYAIDWDDIQVLTQRGGFGLVINAPGGAEIRGAELSLTARPTARFTATGAFAYQNAKMSEADEDLGAKAGERLPNVPRFSGAVGADYEISGASLKPLIGATVRYVSSRQTSFDESSFAQYRLPSYTAVDLRAGFTLRSIDLQLYARNVFDEAGQLSGFNRGPEQVSILQPRTIGINATTRF